MTPEATDTAEESNGWQTVRERVLERDDYECQFCGVSNGAHKEEHGCGLHAHHIIPQRDGGPDSGENLISVCGGCHRTLEEAHAKAVAQMRLQEDCTDTVAAASFAYHRARYGLDELEPVLAEFVKYHPMFAKAFNITPDEPSVGGIAAHSFEQEAAFPFTGGENQIDSEFGFAISFGYAIALWEIKSTFDEAPSEVPDREALQESSYFNQKLSDSVIDADD